MGIFGRARNKNNHAPEQDAAEAEKSTFAKLRQALENGDAEAGCDLAELCFAGSPENSGQPDAEAARRFLAEAAGKGSRGAAGLLYVKFGDGSFLPDAGAEAQEDPSARSILEKDDALYKSGDIDASVKLLLPLADAGNADAQYRLGYYLELGKSSAGKDPRLAVYWYARSAAQGFAKTEFRLARMLDSGKGTAADAAAAARFFRRAAEKGHAAAAGYLSIACANGSGVESDPGEAFKWAEFSSDNGNARGTCVLGDLYRLGIGTAVNKAEAARLYRIAAEKGNVTAQYRLGHALYCGDGVPADAAGGAEWLRRAAEEGGSVDAAFELGAACESGIGTKKDMDEALKWYREAAENGNCPALCRLGDVYLCGKGVEASKAKAYEFYERAARAGSAEGIQRLAMCCEQGIGVAQNMDNAILLYSRAAEGGDARAAALLGDICRDGRGRARDCAEALKWYLKAAENGSKTVQRRLGEMYETGLGTKKDAAAAAEWYGRGAEYGDDTAEKRYANLFFSGENGIDRPKAAARYRRKLEELKVGDRLEYGRYPTSDESVEWTIFDKKDGRLLLISDCMLDVLPFNGEDDYEKVIRLRAPNVTSGLSEENWKKMLREQFHVDPDAAAPEDTAWDTCELRGWLNGEFLENAFTAAEREPIAPVELDNPGNFRFGTPGCGKTTDRVFLLSSDEALKYFADGKKLPQKIKPAFEAEREEYHLEKTGAASEETEYVLSKNGSSADIDFWWLRTPGDCGRKTAVVWRTNLNGPGLSNSSDAGLYMPGAPAFGAAGGVRPAMWLDPARLQ